MGLTLKQFLLFGFLVDFSTSSPSPWNSDGGQIRLCYELHQYASDMRARTYGPATRLDNGTDVTQTEFVGNAYASAAIGTAVVLDLDDITILGALVANQYFLYFDPRSFSFIPPVWVYLGSRYFPLCTEFDGDRSGIVENIKPLASGLKLAKISLPSTSKAKPVALPPTALLHTPPPVGSKCNAWGFGGFYGRPGGILNRLAVTIVNSTECKSVWKKFDSTFVFPTNGTVFCAWVTSNGTAEGQGSICKQEDTPSLIICEDWTHPTPTTNPPGGGSPRNISEVLAMKNERVVPSYLLAGIFRKAAQGELNCAFGGLPPVIYTYTGGVIDHI